MARRRRLCHVAFMGELYKLHMLSPTTMQECVNSLISTGGEENLEWLCKLLGTIGQQLESEKATRILTAGPKFMTNTLNTLKELSNDKSLPLRIRFALLVSF